VAWQIDPFGHSSEVAAEFAEMGFDGLVLGRIDHEDIFLRKNQKTMEMVWRPDVNIGKCMRLIFCIIMLILISICNSISYSSDLFFISIILQYYIIFTCPEMCQQFITLKENSFIQNKYFF